MLLKGGQMCINFSVGFFVCKTLSTKEIDIERVEVSSDKIILWAEAVSIQGLISMLHAK